MASSSVSQESLECEDFETAARRSRIRALRARTTGTFSQPHRNESTESADLQQGSGGEEDNGSPVTLGVVVPPSLADHESPTRNASRLKDKRGRPNHLHKGKLAAKDKRKLREKRRSTGVVHMPSTESTGDSLDDDEKTVETRRNTSYNEVIDADNPQTPEEDRRAYGTRVRNKSPSDLEADLEDNQDYDSTVSQSESNLTSISSGGGGGCSLKTPPPTATQASRFSHLHTEGAPQSPRHHHHHHHQLHHHQPDQHQAAALGDPAGTHTPRESNDEAGGYQRRGGAADRHHQRQESPGHSSNRDLEKRLESERAENRKLSDLLQERDRKIAQLEKEISLLKADLDIVDGDNEKLQHENRALLTAITNLSVK